MPNNLTDNPALFSSPIQVPAAGDPRTDTSVATPFQQLANRTANLAAQLAAIVPYAAVGYAPALPSGVTSGVSALLTCATLAELASIPAANRTNGMLCLVSSVGIYQYSVASGELIPNVVVVPSDGVGSWLIIAAGYGLLNEPNTIVQADSTGRTPAAAVRNGLVAYASAALGVATSTTATYTLFGSALALPGLLPGDLIEARYSCQIEVGGAAGYGAILLTQCSGPGTPLPNPMPGSQSGTIVASSGTATIGANASAVSTFTVPAGGAGTWTVGLYMAVSTGGAASAEFENANLIAQAIRP